VLLLIPTDAEKDVDVNTPNVCLELKGKDYDECVEEWLAVHPSPTTSDVGTANEANYDDADVNDPGVAGDSEITGDTVSESNTGDATVNNVNENEDSVLVDGESTSVWCCFFNKFDMN